MKEATEIRGAGAAAAAAPAAGPQHPQGKTLGPGHQSRAKISLWLPRFEAPPQQRLRQVLSTRTAKNWGLGVKAAPEKACGPRRVSARERWSTAMQWSSRSSAAAPRWSMPGSALRIASRSAATSSSPGAATPRDAAAPDAPCAAASQAAAAPAALPAAAPAAPLLPVVVLAAAAPAPAPVVTTAVGSPTAPGAGWRAAGTGSPACGTGSTAVAKRVPSLADIYFHDACCTAR